jgi:hypothetical protein
MIAHGRSIPVVSYAKTITRLAAYARLPAWLSPRRPQRPCTHALFQQAEHDRLDGSSI